MRGGGQQDCILLIQVVVFREITLILDSYVTHAMSMSLKNVIYRLLPNSYFAILYIGVYLLSPYINKLMKSLDSKALKGFVFTVFALVSLIPYGVDLLEAITKTTFQGLSTVSMYGSDRGYTLVNFAMMYIIGAYLRLTGTHDKVGIGIWSSLMVFHWVLVFFMAILFRKVNLTPNLAWSYCNPIVVFSAVFTFLTFSRLKNNDKCGRLITKVASASFTVYLMNATLLRMIDIKTYVEMSGATMVLHMVLTCIVVTFVSCVMDMLYHKVVSFIVAKAPIVFSR